MTIDEGQIINNFGSSMGGGILMETRFSDSLTLNGGKIISNSALNGGGLYFGGSSDSFLNINNVQFISNTAFAHEPGGGISIFGGQTMLNEGQISHNSAAIGGGIWIYHGILTQTGITTISYNSANGCCGGGAIWIQESEVMLSEARLLYNVAANDGGALFSGDDSSVTIVDSCIVGNTDTAVRSYTNSWSITNTWWGAANGPSGAGSGNGDSVSEGVTYLPFKTEAPVGCPTRTSMVYLPVVMKYN